MVRDQGPGRSSRRGNQLAGARHQASRTRQLWPCPFHDDDDPSFQVDWNRKTWRCWVCAIGGDAAELVKKVNKCDFPTAVKFLADRAGVASPSRGPTGPPAGRVGRPPLLGARPPSSASPPTPFRGPGRQTNRPACPGTKRRPSLTRPPPASGDLEGEPLSLACP